MVSRLLSIDQVEFMWEQIDMIISEILKNNNTHDCECFGSFKPTREDPNICSKNIKCPSLHCREFTVLTYDIRGRKDHYFDHLLETVKITDMDSIGYYEHRRWEKGSIIETTKISFLKEGKDSDQSFLGPQRIVYERLAGTFEPYGYFNGDKHMVIEVEKGKIPIIVRRIDYKDNNLPNLGIYVTLITPEHGIGETIQNFSEHKRFMKALGSYNKKDRKTIEEIHKSFKWDIWRNWPTHVEET